MTEKQVILFVRGEQYYEGVDPDGIELATEGTMTIEDNGDVILEYRETELTGMEGTTTRFHLQGDTVILTRTGPVTSQMVFQQGKPNSSIYKTPWGDLNVTVSTTRLAHRLSERGGILDIKYAISVGHQMMGENQFKIRVKEKTR